jgi:hypothetical protein
MLRSPKRRLALLAPPSHMTTGGDLALIHKALRNSQIRESCGEESRLFMLRSPKWSLAPLAPSPHVITDSDHRLCQKVLRDFAFQHSCRECP